MKENTKFWFDFNRHIIISFICIIGGIIAFFNLEELAKYMVPLLCGITALWFFGAWICEPRDEIYDCNGKRVSPTRWTGTWVTTKKGKRKINPDIFDRNGNKIGSLQLDTSFGMFE